MENNLKPTTCKNCGNYFQGNYCNICGQKVIHGRFTLGMFFNDLLSTFNIERGFFYTVFQLIKNPGKVVNEILGGKTRNYFNPIKYLLVIAGISALIVIITKSFDNTVEFTTGIAKKYSEDPVEYSESIVKFQKFIKDYINVVMLLIVPFYALGFKIVFSRKKLNYAEHLIVNSYAYGTGTLLSIIVTLIFEFVHVTGAFDLVSGMLIMLTTYIYFYYKILRKNFVITTLLSFFSMAIGFLIFMTLYLILLTLVMLILNKFTSVSLF